MKLQTSELRDRIGAILAHPDPAGWQPTGMNRDGYLDLMETILRTAAEWQDERGAIIDPVEGTEHGQTSCRFVAPGAILLSAGRAGHLREKVLRGMDWICLRLQSGEAQSPDFWMREVMTAWNLLSDVDPARRAQWEKHIRAVIPEKHYWNVSPDGSKLGELHNWTIYAAAGEAMREMAGLGPANDDGTIIWGRKFCDKYMPAQLAHFTNLGMYRDPNDPLTYDMTTRLQIATPAAYGFTSPLFSDSYDQLLQCGALSQLLYVSPAGYAPFGGRSGQMPMQEAIMAALGELEAKRHHAKDERLSRAFKRQAHVSAKSMRRWIADMSPLRHVKNGFDPSARHGCENYAKWSVYSLFTASCLGLAYLYADDAIGESPMPAEIGGYTFELQPAFHKIFATCGGTQLEIDTAADPHYDATGLGRFHAAGVPIELGLSMPFPSHPNFTLPAELLPPSDVAIGPGWRGGDGEWIDLAALTEGVTATLTAKTESTDRVEFSISWQHEASGVTVDQAYKLTAGRVKIDAAVARNGRAVQDVRFIVPLLETNGQTTSRIEQSVGETKVRYAGSLYIVRFDPAYRSATSASIANRNGVYRPLELQTTGGRITVELMLSQLT
ncbi:hypothetical protein BH10PLA1_BH10PLA1_05630 [soil metagenome]